MRLWQNMVSGVDELRLEVALKMLKSPHFNAKMNSLKEVCMELGICVHVFCWDLTLVNRYCFLAFHTFEKSCKL